MSRAERRAQAFQKPNHSNAAAFRMYDQLTKEANKRMDKFIQEQINERMMAMWHCCAIVLHKEYGFGNTRILRVLTAMDEMIRDWALMGKNIEDFEKELLQMTGLKLNADQDITAVDDCRYTEGIKKLNKELKELG